MYATVTTLRYATGDATVLADYALTTTTTNSRRSNLRRWRVGD